jgi:hypothetical protein
VVSMDHDASPTTRPCDNFTESENLHIFAENDCRQVEYIR